MKNKIIPLVVVSLALAACTKQTQYKTAVKKAQNDASRVPTSQLKETPWTTWSKKVPFSF